LDSTGQLGDEANIGYKLASTGQLVDEANIGFCEKKISYIQVYNSEYLP